jgi:hypothetical protein
MRVAGIIGLAVVLVHLAMAGIAEAVAMAEYVERAGIAVLEALRRPVIGLGVVEEDAPILGRLAVEDGWISGSARRQRCSGVAKSRPTAAEVKILAAPVPRLGRQGPPGVRAEPIWLWLARGGLSPSAGASHRNLGLRCGVVVTEVVDVEHVAHAEIERLQHHVRRLR